MRCQTIASLLTVQILGLVPLTAQAGNDQAPGTGVWRNYDFVPGDTVWKVTDFSREPIGRFPAGQLEFVKGNLQIVETDSARVLESSAASVFRLPLPRTLPDEFTLEFEIKVPALNMGTYVYFTPLVTSISRYPSDYLYIGGRPGIYRKGIQVSGIYLPSIQDRWVPVKLQVDSAYAVLYVGAERAAQVPTANFSRGRNIEFHVNGNPRLRTYLRNIVVAVGLNPLYEALVATGTFTTRGILFATDSDQLLPESTPVLTTIIRTMQEHPELRIEVEGHTDSQGDDAHNQRLSERRGQSVIAYLVRNGTATGRLTASGKGESMPVGDNTTAEGRQQNRRVVLRLMR